MKQSQVAQIIFSLSKTEKREARRFLESPFFNQRRDVVLLFDWFCQTADYQKDLVKKSVWGDETVSDQELRLRMTYLHRLLNRYLAQKEVEADAAGLQLRLAASLRKRGLAGPFERAVRQLQENLAGSPLRDARHYERQYQLHWEMHQISHARNPTDLDRLQEASDTADIAYIALKLRMLCLLATHQTVYTGAFHASWEAEIIAFAENPSLQQYPAVSIYLHGYRMIQNPGEESHFREFKRLLLDSNGRFADDEMHGLFILAVNYCIRRLNAGDKPYYEQVTDLYKPGLANGYLLENGVLPRFTYYNVVAAGLHAGDLKWVEFFIQHYKNSLEKPYRESAYSFNLARLKFARKDYGAVLDLLQRANFRDVLVNLSSKVLLLKTFYELHEYDLLESHLLAMKNYMQRKRVLGYHRTNYSSIIRYTTKLLDLNFSNKKAVDSLRKAIEQETALSEKDWFLSHLA